MEKLASEIQQNVYDLMRFARLYVATENHKYREYFYKILDIRNGYENIPEQYGKIYWSISEEDRKLIQNSSKRMTIQNRIESLPFDEFEKEKLLESENELEKLINLELEAFNAINGLFKGKEGGYSIKKEANRDFATKLIHSEQHIAILHQVMNSLNEFFQHFEKRITKELDRHIYHINRYNLYTERLAIFQLLFLIFIVITVRFKILKPSKKIIQAIYNFKNNVLDNTVIEIDDQNEMGLIAKEFISMRDKFQQEREEKERHYRELREYIRLVNENIITSSTDAKGYITQVSQAFIDISGYSKHELIGQKHNILRSPNTSDELYKYLWETISSGRTWRGEIENRRKNGETYWVRVTIYPKFDNKGNIVGYTAIRTDITQEKRYELLLNFAEERERELQQYIDLVDENIISSSIDTEGRITSVSKAFVNISGYSEEELIGKKHYLLSNNFDEKKYHQLINQLIHNRTWRGEISNKRKDGAEYWTKVTIYQNLNKTGERIGYTSIGVDITDKKRIEELSIRDDLTKLYNRRYFHIEIVKAIQKLRHTNLYLSLILIDIDLFKDYNNEYGHFKGDWVLKRIGQLLYSISKEKRNITPFRLEGEEFAVLMKSADTKESINFAETFRNEVENLNIEHKASSVANYITVSIGVFVTQWNADISERKLYREADKLLLEAKNSGKNRVKSNIE